MNALISTCGTYRYFLTRRTPSPHPDKGTALFVMLNPSTADAIVNDNTILRCVSFADRWGCAGLAVANLFALRATKPIELKRHPDPIGPDNDMFLRGFADEYTDVVFAWGGNAPPERAAQVVEMFKSRNRRMWCLGVTKCGQPKHPLYIRGDQPLIEYRN